MKWNEMESKRLHTTWSLAKDLPIKFILMSLLGVAITIVTITSDALSNFSHIWNSIAMMQRIYGYALFVHWSLHSDWIPIHTCSILIRSFDIPSLIENELILSLFSSISQEQEIHQHRVQHEVLVRIQRHRDNSYISNYRRVQRRPI